MKTVSLALRNLTRNKRRNAILAVAIAFGFFVVTAIDGLTAGMVGNFENQITQLVGGNVIAQGLEWLNPDTPGGKVKLVNIVRDRDYVKNIVDELDIKYDYYSCFTQSGGTVIFNGKKSSIQLYGRDLTEKMLRDSFQFTSGGVDENVPNGLIISDKIADSLNLQVGDEIIYSTYTVYGQNTLFLANPLPCVQTALRRRSRWPRHIEADDLRNLLPLRMRKILLKNLLRSKN